MEIPKTYEPREVEQRWYPFWESRHFFSPEQNDNPDAPIFSMVIPPPNVTGYLHMGHALNHTLQDVLARWRRMSGDRVLWLPGTDHAGIATQMVVERQLAKEGISRKDIGREEFVEKVWEWKEHSGGEIQKQMRMLGESVDWTRERFTLDSRLSEAVKEVFVRLYDDGLIYRGEYLINWSPGLQTAISDLEVEMKPVKGSSITWRIRCGRKRPRAESTEGLAEAFAESDGKTGLIKTDCTANSSSLRRLGPKTMLGDTAVAFNPEDESYLDLKDRLAVLPLVGRELKFVEDAVVEKDFGTGIVKVTPAHDPNDFAIGKRHALEFITVIGKDAKITDSAPETYRGLDRYDARNRFVADLESAGLLLKVEDHLHNVGHCQRSGVVVEPLISTQWFMRMKTLAEPALEAVARWPHAIRSREHDQDVLELAREHRGLVHLPTALVGTSHSGVVRRQGDDRRGAQRGRSPGDLRSEGRKCGDRLRQDADVLDTWFSSALWPFSTLGWPEETEDLKTYYPTTVLITGPDIIFFWVARMMMMGLKFMGDVPFRTVYINGLVLDPEGQKMSKTKGNVIDPLVVFEKYGTDAARFALASAATPGMPISLQESKLEAARNFANKIWNATRFVSLNCGEELGGGPLDWETEMAPPELADRWILSRFNRIALDVNDALADFRVHEAASLVYHFFWDDFCDWYIELAKPFVTSREGGPAAIAARRRLIYMLERSLRIASSDHAVHIGRALAAHAANGRNDKSCRVPHANAAQVDGRAEKEMSFIIELVTRLRSIRSTFNIGQSTALEARIAPANEEHRSLIESMSGQICRLARVGKLELVDAISKERGFARAVIPGAEIEIPLAGLIDFEKERERLERELARLKGEKDGLEKRLSNEDFIKRAAPDVVIATQSRASEIDGQLERMRGMIEAL